MGQSAQFAESSWYPNTDTEGRGLHNGSVLQGPCHVHQVQTNYLKQVLTQNYPRNDCGLTNIASEELAMIYTLLTSSSLNMVVEGREYPGLHMTFFFPLSEHTLCLDHLYG